MANDRQLIEACGLEEAPRHLIRDRDQVYGERFSRQARTLDIREVVLAPRSPWQNAYAERVIGSIRRECLDHVVVIGERHLREILSKYVDYYNGTRTHLSLAKDAPEPRGVQVYPHRWGVERMFFDLKEVLNLNRLYAANPNAVAMQVYAAAIVYNALRVAQSDGATQVGLAPEALSPAKFYPKVVTATFLYLHRQQWEREIRLRHRRLHLCLVGGRQRWVLATPAPVQVEHRADSRRARRFCPARRHWKSFAHVHGGRRFTELS